MQSDPIDSLALPSCSISLHFDSFPPPHSRRPVRIAFPLPSPEVAMSPIHVALLALSFAGQPNGILLDFGASYCGPCKEMSPLVSRLEREGYPIRKVDVQQDPALASRFAINSIPCFVLIVNGVEVKRVVGRQSEDTLKQMMAQIPMREEVVPRTAPPATVVASAPAAAATYPVQPASVQLGAASDAPLYQPAPATPVNAPVENPDQFTTSASAVPATRPAIAQNDSIRKNDSGRKAKRSFPFFPSAATKQPPAFEGEPVVRAKLGDAQPAAAAQPDGPTGPLASSVRVRIRDSKGENFGSGTIIQSQVGRTIVLTCGHIFRNLEKKGSIEVDVFLDGTTDGERQTFVGKMIRFDEEADVGLISIPTDTPLPVSPVAAEGYQVVKGAPVLSIGCGGGELPTLHNIRVTAVNRYLGPDNLECNDVPAQGRSGGGLFTRDGAVIGVCTAADPRERRGLYAGLKTVHNLLDSVQLSHLYRSNGGSDQTAEQVTAKVDPTGDRGLDADIPEGSVLSSDEESLRETLREAGHAEIVCVIRPINQPRSASKVVVINRASPRFVSYLTDEVNAQDQVQPTTLNVPEEIAEPSEPVPASRKTTKPRAPQKPVVQKPVAPRAAAPSDVPSPATGTSTSRRVSREMPRSLTAVSPLALTDGEHQTPAAPKPYRRKGSAAVPVSGN